MWLDISSIEPLLTTATIGRRIVYLTSTTSTMDVARREAQEGAAEGTLVIAEEQSSGRGRFGRSWVSPPGKNLYLTLILRPRSEALRSLSIISPLATCLAIEAVTGLDPRIKWPNDVLLSGKKVVGILIENELSGGAAEYSLVGIGLNVNFDIPADSEIAELATSLKAQHGGEVSRTKLLASFLNSFEESYLGTGDAAFQAWRARLETLGRTVTVTFREETFTGVAADVNDHGALLIRRGDGSLQTVEAGEVTLRSPVV